MRPRDWLPGSSGYGHQLINRRAEAMESLPKKHRLHCPLFTFLLPISVLNLAVNACCLSFSNYEAQLVGAVWRNSQENRFIPPPPLPYYSSHQRRHFKCRNFIFHESNRFLPPPSRQGIISRERETTHHFRETGQLVTWSLPVRGLQLDSSNSRGNNNNRHGRQGQEVGQKSPNIQVTKDINRVL
jgi:hypothetical protein